MPRGATLLLLESVVPPGNAPDFAKSLDLDMLLFVGGRERTEPEFATLLDRAGFALTRVVPTISTISLVEAGRPADMDTLAQVCAGVSAVVLIAVFPLEAFLIDRPWVQKLPRHRAARHP